MSESAHLPLFFGEITDASTVVLDGDEGMHAAKVRRIRTGERVRVADGSGRYADCTVTVVHPRSVEARIDDRGQEPERTPRIVVAQALPKGDRGQLAVELLTEVGVNEIIPWQAKHCVSVWADPRKADKGQQKWQATAREAAKQSRRARIPVIAGLATTADLAKRAETMRCLVLHESTSTPLDGAPVEDSRDLLLIVGPEGGVAPAELAQFEAAGASVVRLGQEVLRTSTAGVVAVTWANLVTGRWK